MLAVHASLLIGTLLLLLPAAHAHAASRHLLGVRQPGHRRCGHAVSDKRAHNALMAKAEAAVYGRRQRAFNSSDEMRAAVLAAPWPAGGLMLKVQFHVIHWKGYSSSQDAATAPVSNDQIAKQLAVLNRDYRAAGLRFVPRGAPMFHSSQRWTAACFENLDEIYRTVVKEPATTLSVILCDLSSSSGILGVTPEAPNGANEASPKHVAIDFRTLPGGSYLRFSEGRTLTHELGHFFGLLHTFGSCEEDADSVADTPAELEAASGCPTRRDTCPGSPGTDPVWSFMDYADDACMRRFSPGQIARMRAVLLEYRPRLVAASRKAVSKRPKAASNAG